MHHSQRPALRSLLATSLSLLLLLLATVMPVWAKTTAPPCGYAELNGVVTAADTGKPVSGATITARGASTFANGSSQSDGSYSLLVRAYSDSGPYHLFARPGLQGAQAGYLEDDPPDAVTMISGTTTTRNLQLPLGGIITGTVQKADTHTPLAEALVGVWSKKGTAFQTLGGAVADEQGRYTVRGLAPGLYTLHFEPSAAADAGYVPLYLGGTTVISQSQVLQVAGSKTLQANINLPRGITLTGVIRRGDTQMPAQNIRVHLLAGMNDADFYNTSQFSGADSDSQGIYRVEGLPAGIFRLAAEPLRNSMQPQLPDAGLLWTWYNGQAFFNQATPVTIPQLTAGSTYSLNMTLPLGGAIQGKVVDADTGKPLSLYVEATPAQPTYDPVPMANIAPNSIRSETDGSFTIPALYSATYTVTTMLTFGSDYIEFGYPVPTNRVTVTLHAPQTVQNVLLKLPKAGMVTGKLTAAGGQGLAGVEVSSQLADGTAAAFPTFTDAGGAYTLTELSPGAYRIHFDRFDPCGCYNSDYYVAAGQSRQPFTLVTVKGGQVATASQALACNTPPALPSAKPHLWMPSLGNGGTPGQ